MTKVALLGIDAAIPTLVQKFFNMGKLPNMAKLAKNGVWAEGIPAFPTHTASNWNTVSTGAWPKTHGVTDMVVHHPGTPLTEITSGFFSNLCKAEQIWRTAERHGKKNILMKYIGSWPPTVEKSIQVEGFGAPGGPGSRPWGSSPLAVANSSCFCTISLQNATKISFSPGELSSWKNIPALKSSSLPPMESRIQIGPANKPLVYNVLLLQSNGGIDNGSNGHNVAIIARNKDASSGVILEKNQTSRWIADEFQDNDGKSIRASFRMKLMDIGNSNAGENAAHNDDINFKLYVSQVFPLEGWTFPDSLSQELADRFGPFLESISHFPYVFGWIDEDTYLEDVSYQAKWIGKASDYLINKYDWDLYMMQWHGVDNTQHAFLRFDKSVLSSKEAEMGDRVTLSSYEIADELVGAIYDSFSKKNEDIYTFVLSDHGHVMGKRRFFINSYLYQKGLIKLKRDEATGKATIDWNNTQAFSQGMVHVYVNLKGREPHGSVNPGRDYDIVVNKLLDILYDIKDEKTGLRPISLALRNGDAEFLGLSGQMAGDIIFAANPVYAIDNRVRVNEPLFEDLKTGLPDGSIHGQQLPSVDLGQYGTIKSMFIAHGPKIKKGYVRKKPISLLDVAPTIAHILDIPAPRDSEGAVMHDLFE